MDHFPRVSVFELDQELGVARRAGEEGRLDKPARSDTTLDDTQRAIIGAITERLNSARSSGEESLKALEVDLRGIDFGATSNALRTLVVDTEMEIERTKGKFRDQLIGLRQDERGMLRELNYFQRKNEIHREAQYPESEVLHWAIIGVLILTESLANSYFFAKGSDLGLVGGALQALLISVVNIGAAILSGVYNIRNLNHISRTRAVIAGGGLFGYLVFMGFFNLATAHYRAQLGIDPTEALVTALASLMRSPLGINDFDATVLLFIGIIFSLAALIKAYLADDRYPEYGKLDRRYCDADDEYQAGKGDLRDAINGVIDQSRDVLHKYIEEARDAGREFASLVARSDSWINDYTRHAAELREACQTLLNLYRTNNIRVRSSPPPDYFNDYTITERDGSLPREGLTQAKDRVAEIEQGLVQIEDQASTVMQEIKDLNERALKDAETFFKIIEDEAAERLTQDAKLDPSKDEGTA